MPGELKPRILRFEIGKEEKGETIKSFLMRRVGFSSKQLSRFKYRKDGILLNGEKRYVNAGLSEGDVLEIRLTQGGEPVEAHPHDALTGGTPREDDQMSGYQRARDGRLQKIWAAPAGWLEENHPLRILYEDQDILAADKPSGVVCHPSPGHYDDTLSNQVAQHLGRIGQELDVRVTGRLDRDTSGIVIFALNTETAAQLIKQRQEALKNRSDASTPAPAPASALRQMTSGSCFKLYIARVRGRFSTLTGTVDLPLRRESQDSFRMIASPDGKKARTHYCVLAECPDGTSLIACRIEHGRTHQIRVHMAETGHPIVGDRLYGPEASQALQDSAGTGTVMYGYGPEASQDSTGTGAVMHGPEASQASQDSGMTGVLMLHAYRAVFRQPFTGKEIRIEAPLPDWASGSGLLI